MSFWMVGNMEAPPKQNRMEEKPRKKEVKVGGSYTGIGAPSPVMR